MNQVAPQDIPATIRLQISVCLIWLGFGGMKMYVARMKPVPTKDRRLPTSVGIATARSTAPLGVAAAMTIGVVMLECNALNNPFGLWVLCSLKKGPL